jgi:hypothetical protein
MEADILFEMIQIPEDGWVEITIEWNSILNRPFVKTYAIGFNKVLFAKIESSPENKKIGLVYLDADHPIIMKEIGKSKHEYPLRFWLEETRDEDTLTTVINPLWDEDFKTAFWEPSKVCETTLIDNAIIDGRKLSPEDVKKIKENLEKEGISSKKIYARKIIGYGIGISGEEDALPFNHFKRIPFDTLDTISSNPESIQNESVHYGARLGESYWSNVLANLICGPGSLVKDILKEAFYLGPFRQIPPRNHQPKKITRPHDWVTGMGAWDILYKKDQKFIDKVNDWLSKEERLDVGYKILRIHFREINEDLREVLKEAASEIGTSGFDTYYDQLPTKTQIVLLEIARRLQLRPLDVGVGISQLIPIVVLAILARESFAMIEEPESHMHPRLQVRLADLFISQVESKLDSVCYLMETHSEHFLLRLARRIRETTELGESPNAASDGSSWPPNLTPDQVAVYFLESAPGGMKSTHLRLSKEGEWIDRWPKGFFEERGEELF